MGPGSKQDGYNTQPLLTVYFVKRWDNRDLNIHEYAPTSDVKTLSSLINYSLELILILILKCPKM